MAAEQDTEIREVVSDDPSLSPEANRVLTVRWAALAGCTVISVGAFAVLMGWLAGEL